MYLLFYFFSFLTLLCTILSIIQSNLMYALFYFFLSILTTSVIFFILGSYLIGSLQIIIYSGAILVLFVFVVMLLDCVEIKNKVYNMKYYYYFLCFIFFFFMFFNTIFFYFHDKYIFNIVYDLNTLGRILFEPYILIVELISILLLSIVIVVVMISKMKDKCF